MADSFDEAYGRYLESLAKLDETDDISEKNKLFKELAVLLSEMEKRIRSSAAPSEADKAFEQPSEPICWI